jgi:hypothetical protein
VIAALLVLPAAAHATFRGTNGRIAFWRGSVGGGGDIWTVNPDGSNSVNLTNTASALEKSPSWSPDGTQIAYVRDRAIWRMNSDGSGQVQVVPAPPLTNNCVDQPCTGLSDPAWSADGSKIVFDSFRHVHDEFAGELHYDELHTVNPDGTGEALLVKQAMAPRWSPGGSKVGYTFSCDGGGCTDVRWVTTDGSQQFTVYQTDLEAEGFIDWSPDGFLMNGCGEGYCFTVRPDGTGLQKNVPVGHWSPDGQKLTASGYVPGPPGQYDIFTMNTDGSSSTNITNTTGSDEFGSDWQPIPYTGYARPKGASPLRVSLVPSFVPCTSPNRTHGAPLSFPSCRFPRQQYPFVTVGTPDANGAPAKSVGYMRFDVLRGTPGPPNDSDVAIAAKVSDVRCGAAVDPPPPGAAGECDSSNDNGFPDFGGGLSARVTLRITDKLNSPDPAGTGPGTMTDYTFAVPVSCAVTGDTTIGSTCSTNTTADAVVPGIVPEGNRAVWEMGQVQLWAVDSSSGAPVGVFETQGVFVP